jgi:hypothetical protein
VPVTDARNPAADNPATDHRAPDHPGTDHPGNDHPGTYHPAPDHPAPDHAVAVDEYRAVLLAAEQLLDGVDRALASLDDGSYGACQECGSAVDDRDLAEDPLATVCARHRGQPVD